MNSAVVDDRCVESAVVDDRLGHGGLVGREGGQSMLEEQLRVGFGVSWLSSPSHGRAGKSKNYEELHGEAWLVW